MHLSKSVSDLLKSCSYRIREQNHRTLVCTDYRSNCRSRTTHLKLIDIIHDSIPCFHGKSFIPPNDLFLVSSLSHIRGHSLKICDPHSRTAVRQCLFSVKIIDTWNSLPDRAVNAPNINSFKKMLQDCILDVLYHYVD